MYNKLSQVILLFAKFDIICCSETWLSESFSDAFIQFPGKRVFRSDRNGRGGGVCIYIDSKIAPFCDIAKATTFSNRNLEIVSINIRKPGMKHMFICTVYRPPRGNVKIAVDRLHEILSNRELFKKEIWLLGDFNVDYLDRNQPNLIKFNELFKKFGCIQLISDITRPGK